MSIYNKAKKNIVLCTYSESGNRSLITAMSSLGWYLTSSISSLFITLFKKIMNKYIY